TCPAWRSRRGTRRSRSRSDSTRGRSCGLSFLDGQARSLPFGEPLEQASRPPPAPLQRGDRVIGVDAIRPAAVGDVLLALGKPAQALLHLVDRYRDRAGDVPGHKLVRRPRVEDDDVAFAGALD